MAAPTVPDATALVTEGLKQAGYSSPSTAQLTRAEDEWLEEIKNDIWALGKRLKPLQTEYVQILQGGRSRYSFPSDYSSMLTAQLLWGDEEFDVTAGAAGSVTLDTSDETSGEDEVEGYEILIYSGTGEGSISQCYSYDTTTFDASVSPNWETAPEAGDTYVIIDQYIDLELQTVPHLSKIEFPQIKGYPRTLYEVGDETHAGQYFLYPIPDDDFFYAVRIKYYLNLLTLDLASTRLGILYQRWRNLWIQGIKARQLDDDDDGRAQVEIQKYYKMVKDIVSLETYGRTTKQHYTGIKA